MTLLDDYTVRTVALGAATLGALSGALGSFAVLRKQSLLGDAVAHAALPGVAVAYLVAGGKFPVALALGAALAGVVATLAVGGIVRTSRVPYDSALGGVLAVFFGLGLVLIKQIQKGGDAGQSGLDRYLFGQAATLLWSDVQALAWAGGVAVLALVVFWKPFKLIAFDPAFAQSLGWPVRGFDLVLTGLLILAVVLGLQCVGAVLVSALVVAPAVAARQWTDRLSVTVLLAAAFGGVAGLAGTLASHGLSRPGLTVPTGPCVVLAVTALVAGSLAVRAGRDRWGGAA